MQGAELTKLRKEERLTRKELASILGISQSAVAAYEYGQRRPSPEVARRIGDLFSLTDAQIWQMFYDHT